MQTTVLNPKNNWKYWSEADVQLLKLSNANTNVGEKLVFENEKVKVWTIHPQPNATLPFHKHNKNYTWTALTEGKAITYFNDGSVTETMYEIGDTKSFENISEINFFIHNLINTGNSTLIFSTIEFN